jgi:hypothetical protein
LYKKCLKKILRAFEKGLAGKKMPAGTRLGTAAVGVPRVNFEQAIKKVQLLKILKK